MNKKTTIVIEKRRLRHGFVYWIFRSTDSAGSRENDSWVAAASGRAQETIYRALWRWRPSSSRTKTGSKERATAGAWSSESDEWAAWKPPACPTSKGKLQVGNQGMLFNSSRLSQWRQNDHQVSEKILSPKLEWKKSLKCIASRLRSMKNRQWLICCARSRVWRWTSRSFRKGLTKSLPRVNCLKRRSARSRTDLDRWSALAFRCILYLSVLSSYFNSGNKNT